MTKEILHYRSSMESIKWKISICVYGIFGNGQYLQYAIILVQIWESVSEGFTHNNTAAQTNLKLYSLHDNYSKHKSWLSGSVRSKVIAKLPQISFRIIFAPKSESFTVLEYIYAAGLLLVRVSHIFILLIGKPEVIVIYVIEISAKKVD